MKVNLENKIKRYNFVEIGTYADEICLKLNDPNKMFEDQAVFVIGEKNVGEFFENHEAFFTTRNLSSFTKRKEEYSVYERLCILIGLTSIDQENFNDFESIKKLFTKKFSEEKTETNPIKKIEQTVMYYHLQDLEYVAFVRSIHEIRMKKAS